MAEKDDEYEDDEYEDDDEWEDDDEEWEDDEEDEEAAAAKAAEEAKAARKKKLVKIAAILGVVGVLGGVGYIAHLFGLTETVFGKPNVTEVVLDLGKPVTHTLTEVRTDLKKVGRKRHYIRTTIIIQLNEKDLPVLTDETKTAEILDGIKTHLRSLEFQDLQGKKGSERLRFELLSVINNALAPVKAHTILFKDLIIQ